MSSHVPAALRRSVAERANGVCEYCLIASADTYYGCRIEHVVGDKHGGPTSAENLAYACVYCNRFKGSDIATLVPGTNDLVRLYNPRVGRWGEHFAMNGPRVVGLTPVGRATALLLCVNLFHRLSERSELIRAGRYPSPGARRLM